MSGPAAGTIAASARTAASAEDLQVLAGAERATKVENRTFVTLDGIRGVAALCVVVWHMPQINPLPSAYLAVDLFLMMSGFVLAFRYDQRLQRPGSAGAFIVMRLVRLWPLYLLGSLIGAVAVLTGIGLHASLGHYGLWLADLALGALFIPILVGKGGIVFPMNVPGWSLFYEMAINAAFPWICRRLRGAAMGLALAASALALFAIALTKGDLLVTGQMPYFLLAAARVVFGFCMGVQLFRLWARRGGGLPLPPLLVVAAAVACFLIPRTGVSGALVSPLVVVGLMPVLILAAVSAEPSGAVARVMSWLGALSFPLYATHYPVLTLAQWLGARLHLAAPAVDAAAVIAALAVAWLAMEAFDKPFRAWLGRRIRALIAHPAKA